LPIPQSRALPTPPSRALPTTVGKPETDPVPTPTLTKGPGAKALPEGPHADGLFQVTGIQGNLNVPPVHKKKVVKKVGEVRVTAADGTSSSSCPARRS
jgi:hypothetical protein